MKRVAAVALGAVLVLGACGGGQSEQEKRAEAFADAKVADGTSDNHDALKRFAILTCDSLDKLSFTAVQSMLDADVDMDLAGGAVEAVCPKLEPEFSAARTAFGGGR